MKKIGIFGGTFDPVHLGHVGLARDALEQAELAEVVFVPARLQPFKLHKETAPGRDRLAMLRLALEDFPEFQVSSCEMDAPEISYTYLTMRRLQGAYGKDCRLYFLTGTDTFLKIELWREAAELLRNYSFLIGTRPGCMQHQLQACIERISGVYNTDVQVICNRQMDISSTSIRQRLREGAPAADLIPEKVERYIKEHGLYR